VRGVKTVRREERFFVETPDFHPTPAACKPPDHAEYLKVLAKYLTRSRTRELEQRIRDCVVKGLEPLLEGGGGDFAADFAVPVSAQSLCALLNMPDDAWRHLVEPVQRMRDSGAGHEDANGRAATAFRKEVTDLIATRKANPLDPGADPMSGILDRQVNGEQIAEDEAHAIGVQILTGGFDLATAALSACVYLLATESPVQDALRRDMSKIPMAAAEFLRLDPQLHHGDRVRAREVELSWPTLDASDFRDLNFAAGNEEGLVDPDACLIDRLVRLELRLLLEELLRRTTAVQLDSGSKPALGLVEGLAALPIRLFT
jgi:cytochrome P450